MTIATRGSPPDRRWSASCSSTRAGYTASYLNQPIETAGLRAHLRHMLGHGEPQLLLVGRGPADADPPRRPLDEVSRSLAALLSDPDEEKS